MQPASAGFLGLFVGGVFFYVAWTKAAKGLDNTFSIANIQLILWTSAIIGSYVAMAAIKGGFLDDIPENTLLLMGMSGASTSMATIIRNTQEPDVKNRAGAYLVVPTTSAGTSGTPSTVKTQVFEGAFTSESAPRSSSIAKIQMFAWSLVALGIYIVLAAGNIAKGDPTLPNVDQAILGLMGIGHGVYLANKATDKPPA